MSAEDGRGTCQGCGEYDHLPTHFCEHDWRAALKEASALLEEYARHDVTRVCQCCGSGEGDAHRAGCQVGTWIAEFGQ